MNSKIVHLNIFFTKFVKVNCVTKKQMTILNNLRYFSSQNPLKIAFSKILNDDLALKSITFQELEEQSSAVSCSIKNQLKDALYVIILLPQGLEFIITILAVFKAGKIAIPCNIPKRKNGVDRLLAILKDSGSKDIICSEIERSRIFKKFDTIDFKDTNWLDNETLIQPIQSRDISVAINPTAFIQYTSGSTGSPKGVVVSHANLFHNSYLSQKSFQNGPDTKSICWLPNFHDLGLVDGIFQPIFSGFQGFLMTSSQFTQNPCLWLLAITKFEIDYTASPNFGIDFACKRISNDELGRLDLSKLRFILTGAEPIRWKTLQAFTEKFSPMGFNKAKFMTGYGMAEATLNISTSPIDTEPETVIIDKEYLKENRISFVKNGVTLVSSGKIQDGLKVSIRNTENQQIIEDNQIGELWVSGESISAGYLNKECLNKTQFQQEGCYFKTGDLGFLFEDNLYITGRIKELIILNGKNYYPQDVEQTILKINACLTQDGIAVSSFDDGMKEQVVAIVEVKRNICSESLEDLLMNIQKEVFKEHEISLYDTVIIQYRSLAKTTSGKIQRKENLNHYLNQSLTKLISLRDIYEQRKNYHLA